MIGGHCDVVLEGVEVPDDRVLGEVDEGFRHAQVRLGPARMTHVMRWLGAARRAHDVALGYASEREAFGSRVADLGMVQQLIADNEIDLAATRALLLEACRELDEGGRGSGSTSIAKTFAGEALDRVADRATQICGGLGVTARPAHRAGPEGAAALPDLRRADRGPPLVDRAPGAAPGSPGPRMRDASTTVDLDAVADVLSGAGVTLAGGLRAELIEGGRSNLTFVVSDDQHRWVLRRPPVGGTTPSAHDVAREYRVARALETTDVPVARTVALCEDVRVIGSPFTVVEFVDGLTIRTQAELELLDDAATARCVQGLVSRPGRAPPDRPREVGLECFGRTKNYAERQLRRWSGQWELTARDPSRSADRLLERLRERVPEQRWATIVHGDFRIDNTLLDRDDPGIVRAIVDWELSTIGDPVADVAIDVRLPAPGLSTWCSAPPRRGRATGCRPRRRSPASTSR